MADKKKTYSDREKGIRKGKNAELLTNLELPMDYHGSADLYTPTPDAKGEGDSDNE